MQTIALVLTTKLTTTATNVSN